MWSLIYATKKLTTKEKGELNKLLDAMSFSCGADLQEAELPDALIGVVYVKKMYCNEPIEHPLRTLFSGDYPVDIFIGYRVFAHNVIDKGCLFTVAGA